MYWVYIGNIGDILGLYIGIIGYIYIYWGNVGIIGYILGLYRDFRVYIGVV